MDSKTLKALKGSIKKWEKIVDGSGVDDGTDNCPLCKLFWDNRCKKCPVVVKTMRIDCSGTPHEHWTAHHEYKHNYNLPHEVECPECKKLAKAELKFLKSLLPKEKKCKLVKEG